MFVSAVLLAAGASTRFGGPKLLAPVGGEPMVARAARALRGGGADEVIVVLGGHAAGVAAALSGLDVRTVMNPRWEEGMLSSAQAGLEAVDPRAGRIAVSPADLPGLTAGVVRQILAAAAGGGEDEVVVPECAGRRGHPLVLPARLVPRVLAWPASARLSDVLRQPDVAVRALQGFDESVLHDVDRPSDLAPVREATP